MVDVVALEVVAVAVVMVAVAVFGDGGRGEVVGGSVTYVVLWYLFSPYLPRYSIQNQSCLLEQNMLV